jgi:hypothetical protein
VHLWDSDWLDDYLFIGMPVHIWRQRPQVDTPPTTLPLIDRF